MAIPHALPGQVVEVQPLGPRLAHEKTVALFKAQDLEVMRLVLPAGRSLPPHKVPGEITVQCIEGAIGSRPMASRMCCSPASCCTCPAG